MTQADTWGMTAGEAASQATEATRTDAPTQDTSETTTPPPSPEPHEELAYRLRTLLGEEWPLRALNLVPGAQLMNGSESNVLHVTDIYGRQFIIEVTEA